MAFAEGIERGMEHGELAVRAASRVADTALRCRALAAYGRMHFNTGRGIPTLAMEEALSLERSLAEWPLEDGPAWVNGWQLLWSADFDRARDVFKEILARCQVAKRRRGRGRGAVVPQPGGVAGSELGVGRAILGGLAGPSCATRPLDSAARVSRCHHCCARRPDRRRARQIAARTGPRRGRGHRHRAVGPQLGARLRGALGGRRRCGAPSPQTVVRASQCLHARSGAAR